MDTKLKNYSEQTGKRWLCIACGLVFIASGVLLMQLLCRLMYLYDFDHFLRYTVDKYGLVYAEGNMNDFLVQQSSEAWKWLIGSGAVILVTLTGCILTTGTKYNWIDRIFTELQLVLFALAATGCVGCAIAYVEQINCTQWYQDVLTGLDLSKEEEAEFYLFWGDPGHATFEPKWLLSFAINGAAAILLAICLALFLSWVKKVKTRTFWHSMLLGRFCIGISDAVKNSNGVQGKVILLLLTGAILSATWIGLIAVVVFIVFFVPKETKKYVAIREGVENVKQGDLDYKIPLSETAIEKPGELDRLAIGINEISEAMSVAVANELKNQRLKTELISNVSHDLKTPLTSIVSYVDLLKTEGLTSEHAEAYLQIIEDKTQRLQKLTEDLFEAAKASSGAIPVQLTCIDMPSIIGQALAETDGRLAAAQLDVIFTNSSENTCVMADGQLLWRVLENLFINASKYALPGSRVYMDLLDCGEQWLQLDVKNISKDRLNIAAEELMERFKRGDEARNTEGSGLGLAIAKDLTKLMNGEFALHIDGDLFKVSILLPKAEGKKTEEV